MKKNSFLLILLVILGVFLYFKFNNRSLKIPFLNQQSNQEQSVDLEKKPVEQGLTIEINQPKDGDVFQQSPIKVSGKTKVGAEVFINDQQTKADNNGNFSVDLVLDEGQNEIVVAANDELGNYVEKTLAVELATPNK